MAQIISRPEDEFEIAQSVRNGELGVAGVGIDPNNLDPEMAKQMALARQVAEEAARANPPDRTQLSQITDPQTRAIAEREFEQAIRRQGMTVEEADAKREQAIKENQQRMMGTVMGVAALSTGGILGGLFGGGRTNDPNPDRVAFGEQAGMIAGIGALLRAVGVSDEKDMGPVSNATILTARGTQPAIPDLAEREPSAGLFKA